MAFLSPIMGVIYLKKEAKFHTREKAQKGCSFIL